MLFHKLKLLLFLIYYSLIDWNTYLSLHIGQTLYPSTKFDENQNPIENDCN